MFSKILNINLSKILFAITVWIFLCLNAKEFNFSIFYLLRWLLPLSLIVVAAINKTWKVVMPHLFLGFFLAGVLPSFVNSVDIVESGMMVASFLLIVYSMYAFFHSIGSAEKLENTIQIALVLILAFQILNVAYCVLGRGIHESTGRYNGFTTNANTLGIYSNLALWAAYYFGRHLKGLKRWLSVTILVASVVLALLSGSRTALVLILLNLVIMTFISVRSIYTKVVVSVITAAIIFLLFSGYLSFLNIQAVDRLLADGGTSRGAIWDEGIRIWKTEPIFGVGYRVSSQLNVLLGHEGMEFHNSYLSLLSEVGVFGGLLIIIPMLFYLVKFAKRAVVKEKNSLFFVVFSATVTIAICAWGGSFLFSVGSTEGFVFWMLFMWMMVYIEREPVNHQIC